MKKFVLLKSIIILLLFSNLEGNAQAFRLSPLIGSADYETGRIVVKIKPEFRSHFVDAGSDLVAVRKVLSEIGASDVVRKFPRHEPPRSLTNESGETLVDLSLMYEVKFNSGMPIEKAINRLLNTGAFSYAEPVYRMKPLFNPNDPDTASQYYLSLIRAYQAWDITKGDSGFVVGVTDTGTDLDHPDLAAGIRYNYQDPINGVDDDNDGYIDNFMGWDVGSNDNDPSVDIVHGSFVCGLAGAVTDNGVGIAGPGFRTRYLPVKISNNGVLNAAYEGIVYAADHFCTVINCSWGSFASSQYAQDIIDYATFNCNSLVVAAAGNANNDALFYPASYNNVLSVTGTNATDTKWVNSSYGSAVDVSAPGEAVYSTIYDNNYSFSSGTSFASPIVAAAAALLRTQFAFYTPGQIAEQIRATSDNIDTVPGNAAYLHKLGKGRLNMYRALTESPKSVRMDSLYVTDHNDNAFVGNDTLDLTVYLRNYLAALQNLSVTLSCNTPGVTILNGIINPGFMNMLTSYANSGSPFRVLIDPSVPFNTKVLFTLNFTDGSYADWQTFELVLNVDYINVLVNDVGTTITSKSRIGYNFAQSQGIGFTYNDGSSILYEGGLMLGNDTSRVCDQLIGNPTSVLMSDFISMQNVRNVNPALVSEFDLDSRFSDDGASNNKLDVEVNQKTFAWSTPADSKYIIVDYVIRNTGNNPISNFYAGLYADWDIGSVGDNKIDYDANQKMGYGWNLGSPTTYAAIKQLTWGPNNLYALENDGSAGSVNIYDGFTKVEKFTTLTTPRLQAGQAATGNDVSMTLSSGPLYIASGDSVHVAFALIGADNLTAVTDAANAAQVKYNSLGILSPSLIFDGFKPSVFPNPSNGEAWYTYYSNKTGIIDLEVLDITGRVIARYDALAASVGQNRIKLSGKNFNAGTYFIRVSGNTSVVRWVVAN